MIHKRLRSEFESDLQAHQHLFVAYGTPLPPADSGLQDDGSYVPLWRQEVKDERGRKRLHGAFTGGFSAGYFNTVGSKEGWTPSSFISSRSNKRKDEKIPEQEQRAQFMDEEDLADAAEAQVLHTNNEFKPLGFTADDYGSHSRGESRLSAYGDNIGLRLLQKMGWNDERGTEASLREESYPGARQNKSTVDTVASRTAPTSIAAQQQNHRGLGFAYNPLLDTSSKVDIERQHGSRNAPSPCYTSNSKLKKNVKHSHKNFNRVISDDIDSDEDTNAIGPRIQYNRRAVSDLKVKKMNSQEKRPMRSANPLIRSKPLYQPGKHDSRISITKKGTDGRDSLTGFSIIESLNESAGGRASQPYHPLPAAPEGWIASQSTKGTNTSNLRPVGEAANALNLDPNVRANILGETILPGKSVFDFISSASRDRLAKVTGRDDLPIGLGEAPVKAETPNEALETMLPPLNKEVALAALGRGTDGWMPYTEDEGKRARYRAFMEHCAGITLQLPQVPTTMTRDNFLQELREFAQAAAVFRPVTGMMASRFASASSLPGANTSKEASQLSAKMSHEKTENSAETAAKLGMFGPLTRHSFRFFPPKLVSKRFNIPSPAHVQDNSLREDGSRVQSHTEVTKSTSHFATDSKTKATHENVDETVKEDLGTEIKETEVKTMPKARSATEAPLAGKNIVDTSHNAALEAEKAGEALFQAVFGDDSDSN